MLTLKGIDLSEHNGKPDFDKIKADGIDFVMIRMGFGGDSPSQDDKEFERNVSECERVGLPWGTYLYSYALNTNDAKSEVEHAKRLLKGKNPKFPVGFDQEDADKYKEKHGMPSDAMLVDICDTFLSGIEEAGYKGILYASLSWLENQLKSPKLAKYDKWVAQWSDICTYTEIYSMWQYKNNGKVNGIDTPVDLDYCHVDYASTSPQVKVDKPKKESIVKKVEKVIEKVIHHPRHYSVSKGESFWSIEEKFNFPHGELQKLNPNLDPTKLKIGQMIRIPGETISHAVKESSSNKIYIVKSGDSLSKIAADHNMSLTEIENMNPQLKGHYDVIQPGEKINIK